MSDIKKIVVVLILSILAAPLHYVYDYNTLKIKRNKDWTVIDYKGYEIRTTKELHEDVKVEKVKEFVEKVGVECEFIRIVGD